MMAVGDDAGFPDPVCHVHHMDLISDPVHTVENVYRHFGIPLAPGMTAAIDDYVIAKPKGGYGEHSYHFEDHGLDEGEERAKFRPYMVRFGVTAETAHARHKAPAPALVANAGEQSLQS
jgi:hypothetical protein